jgi:hypothetical protein
LVLEVMMYMPLTLFICGRSRAADPTSSSAQRPPKIEDLKNAR